MENSLTLKKTSLATSVNVVDTLKWKLERLIEEDKDAQTGISDYVGMTIFDLDKQIEYLKEVKAEVSATEKKIKQQRESILEGTATFLEGIGVDRLDGVLVSSITVVKEKAPTTVKKYKLLASKKEVEKFLLDAGMAVMEEVEVPATNAKVKVNKRKILVGEIEETQA